MQTYIAENLINTDLIALNIRVTAVGKGFMHSKNFNSQGNYFVVTTYK